MANNRREFIKWMVLASFAPSILAATAKRSDKKDELVVIPDGTGGGRVWLYDWPRNKLTETKVPMGPIHSALQVGQQGILLFEYYGHAMLLLDRRTRKQQKVVLTENEFFNGHGTLSPDGRYLLTVELALTPHSLQSTSRIVVRDARTLAKLHVLYASEDSVFHDLMFLSQDRLIFSRGSSTNPMETRICFFDWHAPAAQGQMSREITLPGIHGNSVHFLPLPNHRFLVAPISQKAIDNDAFAKIVATESSFPDRFKQAGKLVRYEPTPLYAFDSDGAMTKLWPDEDRQMFLRNLSVCLLSTSSGDLIGVTHPAAHNFTIWKDDKLLKRVNLGEGNSPGGIAYSERSQELLVADLSNSQLRFFSVPDFQEKIDRRILLANGGAAHLLRLV